MRQITFELLRHGPPNNQLLSPLTDYLALCENHAAVTIQVPFEHNQLLHRLQALSYQLGPEPRAFQLKDTAQVLGELLGVVPGLIAELNRDQAEQPRDGAAAPHAAARLTHLRLVISASELALLPFELSLTPAGFPGAGQPLLLQPQEPICLTREVRRVADQFLQWPNRPRVLVVCAAPGNLPAIPEAAHIRILQTIVEPWVAYADSKEERAKRLEEHLVVLRNATCVDIERKCAEGHFSHVHILAHGVQYQDGFDVRFGVALHDAADPDGEPDVVSGERLSTIIRSAAPGSSALARPVAITLASCDSGHQGTVAGIGASVAHALHAAGVPMVVASQFPIATAASVQFVEVLYSGLLWGDDPRVSLNDLRRRLHSRFPETHDWASITAYLALPPTFERDLSEIQIGQTMRSIEVAMNYADQATARLMSGRSRDVSESRPPASGERKSELLTRARALIETSRGRLEDLLERLPERRAHILGLLGATEKRCAEVYYSFRRTTSKAVRVGIPDWQPLLERARQHYWQGFLLEPKNSWAVVQYLSLDLLLRRLKEPSRHGELERQDEHNSPSALWNLAHVLSLNDLRATEEVRVRWALGNLVELYVIASLSPELSGLSLKQLKTRAVQRAQDLVDRAGISFEVYSTRRQILRYFDWYSEIARIGPMRPTLDRVLSVLPPIAQPARE